jgi:hypothetical protein
MLWWALTDKYIYAVTFSIRKNVATRHKISNKMIALSLYLKRRKRRKLT